MAMTSAEKTARWRKNHLEEARKADREQHARKRAAKGAEVNAIISAWRKANPEAAHAIDRRRHLRRAYNLSDEEYNEMHTAQNGLCAICGQPETLVIHGKRAHLAVDHPKGTDQIRLLLCQKHNMGIGLFNHDPRLLRAAADYLDKCDAKALQPAQRQV